LAGEDSCATQQPRHKLLLTTTSNGDHCIAGNVLNAHNVQISYELDSSLSRVKVPVTLKQY
jgi:hypothetical protein